MDDVKARGRLLNEFDLEAGAGLGELAGQQWRIGSSSNDVNINRFLARLDRCSANTFCQSKVQIFFLSACGVATFIFMTRPPVGLARLERFGLTTALVDLAIATFPERFSEFCFENFARA